MGDISLPPNSPFLRNVVNKLERKGSFILEKTDYENAVANFPLNGKEQMLFPRRQPGSDFCASFIVNRIQKLSLLQRWV